MTPEPSEGATPWGAPLAGIGDEAAPDARGQCAALRQLGWHAIELRSVDGVGLAELPPRDFADLAARLHTAGLEVVCLDSTLGNWASHATDPLSADLATLETLAQQAAVLRCRRVRVMSYPGGGLPADRWRALVLERLGRLARRAEQLGLTLLIENCSGWAGTSAARLNWLLDEIDSPALAVLFDTGNGVPHGYDGLAMLERLLPRVGHVHVKDAAHDGAGGVRYTLPGQGEAQLPAMLDLLWAGGYRGPLSIEPHLSLQPHTGGRHAGGPAPFVAAGRALATLLADRPRPAVPDLR
ncbi:sugar phosphate isomerase/epimerase family protein [Streptomyces sp. DSM 44915]|uniref:Sugar phosphate isomerase/epimerase family protein n=1 Tax=Streptomyces chisholmiae TaxID=3075540 RepID=A0ABU2JNI9_9ACTN|nr:sugar phosphate isomerase/epimerase family protein [Streptomyces sp. DSM 44915]MDT0266551.1 sugar phosphate isomerase/epimerase family protein [Streptomyces sp. DSM 44915]